MDVHVGLNVVQVRMCASGLGALDAAGAGAAGVAEDRAHVGANRGDERLRARLDIAQPDRNGGVERKGVARRGGPGAADVKEDVPDVARRRRARARARRRVSRGP